MTATRPLRADDLPAVTIDDDFSDGYYDDPRAYGRRAAVLAGHRRRPAGTPYDNYPLDEAAADSRRR